MNINPPIQPQTPPFYALQAICREAYRSYATESEFTSILVIELSDSYFRTLIFRINSFLGLPKNYQAENTVSAIMELLTSHMLSTQAQYHIANFKLLKKAQNNLLQPNCVGMSN